MIAALGNNDRSENRPLLEREPLLALGHPRPTCIPPFIAVLLLLALGVIFLHVTEGWGLVVSAYVLCQIITTVGYGDFTPTRASTKIFMCVYALAVLVAASYFMSARMGMTLHKLSDYIVDYLAKAEVWAAGGCVDSQRLERNLLLVNRLISASLFFLVPAAVGTIGFYHLQDCRCDHWEALDGCIETTQAECIETGGHTFSLLDCLYMAIMTLSTIGFGDIHPKSTEGQVFSSVWMLTGVSCTLGFVDQLSNVLFEDERSDRLVMAEELLNMDYETFLAIDKENKGYLSKDEFMTYSLIKYACVSPVLIQKVTDVFSTMDRSGDDKVTWEEIGNRQGQLASGVRRFSKDPPLPGP